jgi:hypothetical protein
VQHVAHAFNNPMKGESYCRTGELLLTG